VEIGLKDASIVRGVLYGYTAEHLELEVAGDRTVKLHRSWVASLKAAPAGSAKSAAGAIPRGAGDPYSSAPARTTETPVTTATPPPTTPTAPPLGAAGSPGTSAPAAKTSSGALSKGLVFQLKMGGNLLTFLGSGFAAWLNGSFMLGYKMDNITIGVGLEMNYADDNLPNMEPDPISTSTTMMLFQPTLEYYLAERDHLVLYLSAGLHVGFVKMHSDPGADITDPMLGFHAGLGMRYFFHPRIAVGIEGGLRGLWMLIDNTDIDEDDNHLGNMAIYGSATLTAIW